MADWFRVDVGFFDHPKVIGLTPSTQVLYLACLAYSRAHKSDGHIPAPIVKRYGSPRDAKALVDASLWHENGSGYVVHDYDRYQETREEIESRQADWRERQRRYRDAKKRRQEPEESA